MLWVKDKQNLHLRGSFMSVLVCGIALFVLAFAVHIGWWRARRPLRSGQVLIFLLVAVIVVGWIGAIVVAIASPTMGAYLPGDIFAWLQALVLALAVAAAYAMTYPAIEVESPIFVIIEAIAQRGTAGITIDEFHRVLDNAVLVTPRLHDLLNEGLVAHEDGRYRPTPKGLALARIFVVWRRLHRAGLGG